MADKKTLELQIQVLADKATEQLKVFSKDIKDAATNAKGFTGNAKNIATSISAMQKEASKTATSLKLFNGSANELKSSTQKMKQTIIELIQGGLSPESKEIKNLVAQYKELDSAIDSTQLSQDGFLGIVNKMKSEIGALVPVMAAVGVDKFAANLAKGALDVNNSFQAAKDNFGIMLGDMQAGAGLFNELQEFNFWTPFDIESTSQAAKVLISAKVQLGDITKYLTKFGDIAQGDAQRFQSFINAFSKASAKGKADMEVLNVYTDQGVQIIDELGKTLGKTSAEIVKMSSEGKISFQDLDNALSSLAGEGGLYYNSMATAAMRLDSVQAGLDESVKALQASFGAMLAPAISSVLTALTGLVDWINNSPIMKGVIAAALITIVTIINGMALKAIIAYTAKLIGFIAKTWSAYAAQMSLNSSLSITNPLLIAGIAAVGAATAGYVAYAASLQQTKENADDAAFAIKKLQAANANTSLFDGMNEAEIQIRANSLKRIIQQKENEIKDFEEQATKLQKALDDNPQYGVPSWLWSPIYKKDFNSLEEVKQRLEDAKSSLAGYTGQLNAANTKLEEFKNANEEVKKALQDLGSEWQDKLESQTATIDDEERKALNKLTARAKTLLGENYAAYQAYQQEETALHAYYSKKRLEKQEKEIETALKLANKWIYGSADIENRIANVVNKYDLEKEKLDKAYKDNYLTQTQYSTAVYNLEKQQAMEIAALRQSSAIEYWNEWKKQAIASKDYLAYAGASFNIEMNNTDLGQLIDTIKNGGNIFMTLISIVIKAIASLNSFKEAVNFIQKILKRVFSRIEPQIKKGVAILEEVFNSVADALTPVFAILVALGNEFQKLLNVLGTPLNKILEEIAYLLIDFYNEVLVPLSADIAPVINMIIDWINGITGLGIKHLEAFEAIVIATEEYTEEIEKAQELLKKKYQRMQDSVTAMLNSQLESLRSQYELGLISREEYETQAEKYSAAADEKIYDIEKEMAKALEEIKINTANTDENTYAALSDAQKETVKTAATTGLLDGIVKKAADLDPTGLTQAVVDKDVGAAATSLLTGGLVDIKNNNVAENIANVATGGLYNFGKTVTNAIAHLFGGGWDVGSYDIPQDQFGMVHKGETIIPRTFAEGIRNGELALVGGNGKSSGNMISVSVNVNGSVVTENELVDVVYQGIAKGIQSKRLTPLTA